MELKVFREPVLPAFASAPVDRPHAAWWVRCDGRLDGPYFTAVEAEAAAKKLREAK